MQLTKIHEIKGKIILKSGLHIGSGDTEMHIGGTDNPIVKHPHTQEPYIPGSSLKGKVRSLLELKSGLMLDTEGEPIQASHLNYLSDQKKEEAIKILKLFGTGGDAGENALTLGPTRVSFADCPISETWLKEAKDKRLARTEIKSENRINRIMGTAEDPRCIERVPAGVQFDFSVTLKLFTEDDEKELLNLLLTGLKLLTYDALGGSGSRGYGRIQLELEDQNLRKKFEEISVFQARDNL